MPSAIERWHSQQSDFPVLIRALRAVLFDRYHHIGANSIYANNANRTMCTERGITTYFARKGPKPKEEAEHLKTSRRIIGNLRATVMEGIFGNQKQHYAVGYIKARNMFSETLLLFFGIHTANAAYLPHGKWQRK